jgi:hypothetical protein
LLLPFVGTTVSDPPPYPWLSGGQSSTASPSMPNVGMIAGHQLPFS